MIQVMALPLAPATVPEIAGSRERLTPLVDVLRELVRGFLEPYRPERHYMRGPGPKWRERHALQSTRSAPTHEQGR
jgi:hypothetical protein